MVSPRDLHVAQAFRFPLVPTRRRLAPQNLSEESTPLEVRTLRQWLRTCKPDAIITPLRNLRDLLKKAGARVPDDVGVATLNVLDGQFDCGIDQNSLEVGRVAMATLASLIHQNERGVPPYCRRILVEGRRVDGSSLPPRK